MLSLIPAVLLLILHGPAGVERSQVDGKLGQALRVWAAQARQEGNSASSHQIKSELKALLALSKDSPDFSRFVAQVFQLSANLEPELTKPQPEVELESDPILPDLREQRKLSDGFLSCRRTRDGPFGA